MRETRTGNRTLFIPLRYRFIIMTTLMLIVLLGTLSVTLGSLQSRTIRKRIETQGLFIARNLAAVSMDDLLTYNYIALEQSANRAATNPDVVFIAMHDKEGQVAGYSGRPDLQNKLLDDEVSRNAVSASEPLIQEGLSGPGKTPVLNVALPVFLPGTQDRWGTIRVCLSLEPMNRQISQTRWIILAVGIVSLAAGILISNLAARRITKPLDTLMTVTEQASKGNLNQDISIRTGDEVGILASHFSSMIQDIVAHKEQLQQRLIEIRQLQKYSEKILDTMGDGLISVTMEGIVRTLNPAARTILGIPESADIKGIGISELLRTQSELHACIQRVLQNSVTRNQEEIHLVLENDPRVILISFGVLKAEETTAAEIIFNLHDITDLKRMEARIRQAQRLADLGIIAAGLAHEIRNPLSAIKTFAGLLPQKIEKPGFLEKFQRTVPREINRLNKLVEELLELARPPKYNFAIIDIGELLEQTLELMEDSLEASHIRCIRDVTPNLPEIRADADQMAKVFHNLIRNAAQVMPDGGDLTVRTVQSEGRIHIAIQDTGPGMSQEMVSTIFTPFFTTKHKGTGLGLAITQKVITEHGGEIRAASTLGSGSCFTVMLPVASS